MTRLRLRGDGAGPGLAGHVIAPPDKSIAHRAFLLAALGTGPCRIEPWAGGADNQSTLSALEALGVRVERDADGVTVHGVGGAAGLRVPSAPIDCGNSGTTMRMLAGALAGLPGRTTLSGDASLCRRPMGRLAPLRAAGATLEGRTEDGGRLLPPITIGGVARPRGACHVLTIASAQLKSACLLAGLAADGPTEVWEPAPSRDHTERLLRARGVRLETLGEDPARGVGLRLEPLAAPWINPPRVVLAPDLSSAAFLLALAAITGAEGISVRTGVNPSRAGVLDALAAFGATPQLEDQAVVDGEPIATVRVSAARLRATELRGTLALRAIDELPVLAAVAAFAEGTTRIRDAAELRVKESDRLAATAGLLRAFGARVDEHPDGLDIHGDRSALRAAEVDGGADHRLAMTAAVLGLSLPGWTEVGGADIIGVSYPGFADAVTALGGTASVIGG